MRYQPIENYGIIGNLETVALVGINGSIDFMCFPRFDSPTVFAALLDDEKGGHFSIAPVQSSGPGKQFYLPDSNILLTRISSHEGTGEISDFMTMEEATTFQLIRRIKCVRGSMLIRMVCAPRFNYARTVHHIARLTGREILFIPVDPAVTGLRLRSSIPLKVQEGMITAEFSLQCGESVPFVLESGTLEHEPSFLSREEIAKAFKDTLNFWRQWVKQSRYTGRWHAEVNRSALVLKLLTCRSNGAIVAAPTFSLPEKIGGWSNWDYRATWIRDASFSVCAFMRLGLTEEVAAFMKWIEARCAEWEPTGGLQVLYRVGGHHQFPEKELNHLQGYRDSQPVRIGNEAYRQLQLDMYGPLLNAVYLYNKSGKPISYELWTNLVRLINWLCENWQQKDAGIWEARSAWREFLYSRMMCWVAIDRGIRLALHRSFPAPLDHWEKTRNLIYLNILKEFWDPQRETFVRAKDDQSLDASCLLMPLVKFISPIDPQWLSTLKAIEQDLISDSFVYRHLPPGKTKNEASKREGTFSMCSFWYVECLSRAGDLQKARLYFEKMLGHANDLGLYAEELGTNCEHLGNYPQALTHLALINAAYDLNRRMG